MLPRDTYIPLFFAFYFLQIKVLLTKARRIFGMNKNRGMIPKNLENVKQVLIVLSGKGGVGKSTVAVQLAKAFVARGKKVGLLDLDICGPSVPKLLAIEDGHDVHQSDLGWVPVKVGELSVMSIGFLIKNKNDAVIWRGPKKSGMINQFISDVVWGELDYLVVDTPPGTSDEHMTVMEALKFVEKTGILVTTPTAVSSDDVRREITFCQKTGLNIYGIIENFTGGIKCSCCGELSGEIFAGSGAEILSRESGIKVLGKIPIDLNLGKSGETGENFNNAQVFFNICDLFI